MRTKMDSVSIRRHPQEHVITSPVHANESVTVDHYKLDGVHSGLFVHEKKKWLRRWIFDQHRTTKLEDSPKEHSTYHEDSSDDEAIEKKWLRRWAASQSSAKPESEVSDSPKEHGDSSDGDDDDWTPFESKTPRQQFADALDRSKRRHGTKRPLQPTTAPLRTIKEEVKEEEESDIIERPRKRIKRETKGRVKRESAPVVREVVEKKEEDEEEVDVGDLEDNVQKVLATAGVSPDSIIKLINNEEERTAVIRATGFSNNYIMKLQRKVLRSAAALQLRQPDSFTIGNTEIHVLFDSHNGALFIKKELCELLGMKGTTFSYWKKKSNVEEIDTSKDFRLMDQCRSIFGGRSTYTLYSVDATLTILTKMEASRQKGFYRGVALTELIALARRYVSLPSTPSAIEKAPQSPHISPMEGLDRLSHHHSAPSSC